MTATTWISILLRGPGETRLLQQGRTPRLWIPVRFPDAMHRQTAQTKLVDSSTHYLWLISRPDALLVRVRVQLSR